MKKHLLYIILFLSFSQYFYSQEDGVVAFNIPIRNSLKFNKYIVNPTFSFVREQNKYISFTNKREWVQFDNAPQTYLFSYSGRLNENMGAGVGLFQQNYGVLTTFGGVLNFAYNTVLDTDKNLTFGMNLGFYQSGINTGSVITNFPDPSLDNVPTNMVLTVNPGINYGIEFLDFGVSLNNIVAYNIKTNKMIEDNPEQSIQGHIMYTGYFNSRGFFDQSKFSGLVRSEFKKDKTVISGLMMVTVPKGMWAQAGYSSLYGVSGGIGFNLSNQIAIEYNYEKAMGDLSGFGSSHEVTLAYKFKKNNRYIYSDDGEEGALITPTKKSKRSTPTRKSTGKTDADFRANRVAKAKIAADAKAKTQEKSEEELVAEERAKVDEEARLKLEQEAQAKAAAEEEARLKLEQEAQAKAAAEEARLQSEQEARAKAAAEEARLQSEQEAQAKATAEEARLQSEQEALAKVAAAEEARLKLEQEALAKAAAEEEARLKSEEEAETAIQPSEDFQKIQQLLTRLSETVSNKEKDLKDLKNENDLSEQGIYLEPKPFKSVSAENAALESLKTELDNVITNQNQKIIQLENLFSERLENVPNMNDSINVFYKKAIQDLKTEQSRTRDSREKLLSTLEEIQVATEIERKRRIKRAVYDNEQDRYLKDRAALNVIKQNTPQSAVTLTESDFDFGEEQSTIQIIKDVKNVESGYYMVLAVQSDVSKRDDFLKKVISTGQADIDFFFDVNTNKYFIYSKKYDDIASANKALQSKGNEPYNSKMSIVKIEN